MQFLLKKKDYNYECLYLSYNNKIKNISEQLNMIRKFNINNLIQYRNKIEELNKTKRNSYLYLIQTEILEFINNYEIAYKNLIADKNRLNKGLSGENKVFKYIEEYSTEWKYIANFCMEHEENKVEHDFIIISPKGIFTIEVKNVGSRDEILHFTNTGLTVRKNKKGSIIGDLDILQQSNRHLAYLKKLLFKTLGEKIRCEQIIIIASDINVVNDSLIDVIGINNLYPLINSKDNILSENRVEYIYNELNKLNVDQSKYSQLNYADKLTETYKEILKSIIYINENIL